MSNDIPPTFPASLNARERQAIESYAEHGTFKGAARAMGLSEYTISDYLKTARLKANAHETVVLVARYLKATLGAGT